MAQPDNHELILRRLASGTAAATELGRLLGVSQATVSRLLRSLATDDRVLRIGSTRGARYALRRPIEGIGSQWPLYRVDSAGDIEEVGVLHCLSSNQYLVEPSRSAREWGFAWDGIFDGLPYFLQDQRPGGFLGRAVPARYPDLELPRRVIDWNDDHYLRYFTQHGSDAFGDLILGKAALDDYFESRRRRTALSVAERAEHYPQLAERVMTGDLPGSSAHGEQPKFTALLRDGDETRHVLVKFSPLVNTPIGTRWSDLLIAEHHAHGVLATAGAPSAVSTIHSFGGRTFLEVIRFDRQQVEGRRGVSSLLAIDGALHGRLDNWIAAATRLHRDGKIDTDTLEQIRLVSTFGALIANSDRHFGNLSFFDDYRGRFTLAPIYDMLPMLFAPEHDQIVSRIFDPPGPSADTLHAYARALDLARAYWRQLADDSRISDGFRAMAEEISLSLVRTAGVVRS